MPTDRRPVSLFLFAHQDDEMGVFGEIDGAVRDGKRVVCLYVTDGAGSGTKPDIRNAESISVMAILGVNPNDLHFLGARNEIPDGALVAHLDKAWDAVYRAARQIQGITSITFHAWEGGHQDHDAVHLIGVALAACLGLIEASQQFTLYRSSTHRLLPYVVFRPLSANGAVIVRRVSRKRLLLFVRLLSKYRSQWRSLGGLAPFMLFHYFTKGSQILQPIDVCRICERPHAGLLLYEKRTRYRYADLRRAAASLVAKEELLRLHLSQAAHRRR